MKFMQKLLGASVADTIADARFGDYCYGSKFAIGQGIDISNQRYIERVGAAKWRYMEIKTQPDTDASHNPAAYLQPVSSYTVLADNISFGNALERLHQYEAGAKLLGEPLPLPEEEFPAAAHYKPFALREGLIFDTKHRLHTSHNGRPEPAYADARFPEADVSALARVYRAPNHEDYVELVECSSSFQVLEKALQNKTVSENLAEAADYFVKFLKDPVDYRFDLEDLESNYDNKKYNRKASEAIDVAISADPELKGDRELREASQMIRWLHSPYQLRHRSQRDRTMNLLEACGNAFYGYPADRREFFTCIVVSDEFAEQTLVSLRQIADKWQQGMKNPNVRSANTIGMPTPGFSSAASNQTPQTGVKLISDFVDRANQIKPAAQRNAEIAQNVYFHALKLRKPS